MGSLIQCWCCKGRGWVPADMGDESLERCSVVGCEDGQIAFPLTAAAVRDDLPYEMLTDGYLCVAEYVEGTCQHCTEISGREHMWLKGIPRHVAEGWIIPFPEVQCDHFGSECRCG